MLEVKNEALLVIASSDEDLFLLYFNHVVYGGSVSFKGFDNGCISSVDNLQVAQCRRGVNQVGLYLGENHLCIASVLAWSHFIPDLHCVQVIDVNGRVDSC